MNNAKGKTIQGGAGSIGGVGGAGVANLALGAPSPTTIGALNNSGSISGGSGATHGAGGAGVANSGTITSLTNNASGQ